MLNLYKYASMFPETEVLLRYEKILSNILWYQILYITEYFIEYYIILYFIVS